MKAILHSAQKVLARDNGVLFILGDGRSMLSDLTEFMSWDIGHDAGCIGRCVKSYPGHVKHWFNADGETAIAWTKQLKEQHQNGLVTHTIGPVDGFDVDWDIEQPDYHYREMTGEGQRMHGSSALFAVLAGLEMGYDKVILGGCPMDAEGHWYFEPTSKDTLGPLWLGLDYMAWLDLSKETDKVRSLSGYTAQIMGEASRQWLIA
jgi:hypothetical protein